MARTFAHKLATDRRFWMAFVLLGVVISVPVGLVTGRLGAAGIVISTFSMTASLCQMREERLANRQHSKID
jgi:hypothetical protein